LPFADKSVDFIYCRHVLEDLHNPLHVCQEMSRVAKAGYIETPSPIAEVCYGTDGMVNGKPPTWRGYHHHRNIIWNDCGTLYILPKLPIIEHLVLGELEWQLPAMLNAGPAHWNTYLFWTGEIKNRFMLHERDFVIAENYSDLICDGIKATYDHHQRIAASGDMGAA
jgi:SAM-dependent methyltransferase